MQANATRILVATRNSNKLAEIRAILASPCLVFLDPDAVGDLPEVDEDGDTFEANAIKKAVTLAQASGMLTLADDSGLEVDVLGGEPGVYSARYAGEPCDDAANNLKLLAALQGETNRRGRFRCAIALATPDGASQTVDGCCEGHIAEAPQGTGGFGYDPLFVPEGFMQSFGELDIAVKHCISHRAAALRAAREAWLIFRRDLQRP